MLLSEHAVAARNSGFEKYTAKQHDIHEKELSNAKLAIGTLIKSPIEK